jgi:hypothetical protein
VGKLSIIFELDFDEEYDSIKDQIIIHASKILVSRFEKISAEIFNNLRQQLQQKIDDSTEKFIKQNIK